MDNIQMPCRRRAMNAFKNKLKALQEIPKNIINHISEILPTNRNEVFCPKCRKTCKNVQGLRSHQRRCR